MTRPLRQRSPARAPAGNLGVTPLPRTQALPNITLSQRDHRNTPRPRPHQRDRPHQPGLPGRRHRAQSAREQDPQHQSRQGPTTATPRAREPVVDPVRTWVALLDRASRHGYSVITTFDEESHVDVVSRQIRVSADQSPATRVRNLERLVHTVSQTVDRATTAPRRESVYPPVTINHLPGVPTEQRVVAAIPAARASRPAATPNSASPFTPESTPDSTPLFDTLLRELGWVHRDNLTRDGLTSPHITGYNDVLADSDDTVPRDVATNLSTAHTAQPSGPVLSCDLVAPRLGAFTAPGVIPAHDLAQARAR
jgi:hypothetical protein